ncbi:hypothetical protein Tco_0838166 [Tanacetum coccineum]|uniref:Uncharacterized protein n=1 Tax=Tanacetum coccineum TaxID=301880 RepID=A0ABQ5ARN6_9ASTR
MSSFETVKLLCNKCMLKLYDAFKYVGPNVKTLIFYNASNILGVLQVTPSRAESELEASVDKLFDEGGTADQGDSSAGSGQDAETKLVTGVKIIVDENVIAERPKSPPATEGKFPFVLKELLASSILNVEVGVEAVATLLLVSSSVSTTPRREGGNPTDSITGFNLHTIGASERFVISSDSSHHSSTHASGDEVDSIIRSAVLPPVMTEAVVTSYAANDPPIPVPGMGTKITSLVHASMFHDSDFTEMNVFNDSLLDDFDVSCEFIDHLAPPALFSQIREMEYHYLFTEFNVGTAHQACLNAEVRMRTKYFLSERNRLESECKKQADLLKARDDEVSANEATEKIHANEIDVLKLRNVALENEKDSLDGKVIELQSSVSAKDLELKDLNVAVSFLRSQNDGLVDQVHALETTCSSLRGPVSEYEQLKEQIEEFQDAQMNIVNDKVAKLDGDLLEMALHLEEKFYPHLLTTISGWSHAIEKGMQDGLSADIDHEKAGRSLADVVAYNPAAKADYNSAMQRLREVDFPLLAELSSHKDASTADIIDLLCLESLLADAPGMSDLQPDVEQVTLPIHRPEDQVVLGETSLSFALSVAHSRVENIRENVAAHRSALIDVWVPLVDPLSAENLIGTSSTPGHVPAAVVTTKALSTTFASVSSVHLITIDDYEIIGTDGQEDAQGSVQGNAASFPTVEFEKEELDTTP